MAKCNTKYALAVLAIFVIGLKQTAAQSDGTTSPSGMMMQSTMAADGEDDMQEKIEKGLGIAAGALGLFVLLVSCWMCYTNRCFFQSDPVQPKVVCAHTVPDPAPPRQEYFVQPRPYAVRYTSYNMGPEDY